MSDFDDKRKGTGTNEWSERTENIGASDFPVDGEHGNSRPDRSPFGFSGVRRRSFELACRVLIPQTSTALMRCRIALACNIRRY